jgi:transposase
VIGPTGTVRVMVATRPVDFRKGAEGLAALVRESIQADPFSGTVYVFRAKRADRVKLIYWDGTGVCLFANRLETDQFCWPNMQDRGAAVGAARRTGLEARPRRTRDATSDTGEFTAAQCTSCSRDCRLVWPRMSFRTCSGALSARISVSFALLTATMNQKSSLREVPQLVSHVLTANNRLRCRTRLPLLFPRIILRVGVVNSPRPSTVKLDHRVFIGLATARPQRGAWMPQSASIRRTERSSER